MEIMPRPDGLKGMCREYDWIMQYSYLLCLVQSMESIQEEEMKSDETMKFHSKRFCFISHVNATYALENKNATFRKCMPL